MIRQVLNKDAHAVSEIYNYYIENTVVTFEESPTVAADFEQRFAETKQADLPWLVLEQDGEIQGYAYASKWKGRCAYRYSVEVTVYLSHLVTGKGFGSALYKELFKQLKTKSMHVVMGGIALPNDASIALHEKFGMKKVAHFDEVGYKFGRWVDVAYWQGMLDAIETS